MATKLEKILELDWATFCAELMKDNVTEDDLTKLADLEKKGANRFSQRMRIGARRRVLQAKRERAEIAGA